MLTLPELRSKDRDLVCKGASCAMVGTTVFLPSHKLVLDMGIATKAVLGANTVVITHFHRDHWAGLLSYDNWLDKLVNVVVPTTSSPFYDFLLKTENHLKLMTVHELVGNGWNLGHGKRLEFFPTHHYPNFERSSYGALLREQRSKLRGELQHLSSQEIGELARGGAAVSETYTHLSVAYTGDTRPSVLEAYSYLYEADMLFMECTYLYDHERTLAQERGHTVLTELLERASRFRNKKLVLTHFSAKYTDIEILKQVAELQELLPETEVLVMPRYAF